MPVQFAPTYFPKYEIVQAFAFFKMLEYLVVNQNLARYCGLTVKEAIVFSWLVENENDINGESVFIDNKEYKVASISKAIEDMPLIATKKDTMYRYFKRLQKVRLITYKRFKGKECIRFSRRAIEYIFRFQPESIH